VAVVFTGGGAATFRNPSDCSDRLSLELPLFRLLFGERALPRDDEEPVLLGCADPFGRGLLSILRTGAIRTDPSATQAVFEGGLLAIGARPLLRKPPPPRPSLSSSSSSPESSSHAAAALSLAADLSTDLTSLASADLTLLSDELLDITAPVVGNPSAAATTR
jgi:hypothetical protein